MTSYGGYFPAAGIYPKHSTFDLKSLLKIKLPPLSSTVSRVTELLREPEVSTKKMADAVGYDPILAARLLKLANSTMYMRRRPAASLVQAIEMVGLKSLYDIVVLGAFADGFAREIRELAFGRMIWEHSIVTGLLARELSAILGLRGTEEAFLCGLLHDIGRIFLLKAETARYEAILECETEAETLAREEDAFGYTHAEIGAYIADSWRLPDTVCSVIMNHHEPSETPISTVTTYIVNAADLISNVNGYGLRLVEESEIYRADSALFLKLDNDQINLAWQSIQPSLAEIVSVFA